MKKITIIGLGPGDFSLLTMAAWELMTGGRPLWLRTAKHPTAEEIKRRGIEFHSYDSFYYSCNFWFKFRFFDIKKFT